MKNSRRKRFYYLLFDYLAASAAWGLFFLYRKLIIEHEVFGHDVPVNLGPEFWSGVIGIPFAWLMLYYFTGFYKKIYHRSRTEDLLRTFLTSLLGVTIIFFLLLLNDTIGNYTHYYKLFATLFGLHFLLTLIPRMVITGSTVNKVHRREIGFPTLMIGSNENAVEVYNELVNQKLSSGHIIIGFINIHLKEHYQLSDYIPHLGGIDDLTTIVEKYRIEEVIVALEPNEHKEIGEILNKLSLMDLRISAIPSMTDIMTGKVKMSTIFYTPLIEVTHELMAPWQENIKQISDFILSLLALILLLPLELFLVIGVLLSGKGPIIYKQERIGRYGRSFHIYKFRSMVPGAEQNGPELSSKNDQRITPFGQFMRKHRLDEIPNFFNVLKGDMSLVGPRPERQYFIDQITEIAPHYVHLHKVKPGITSWGQVKYGYAENVEQMVKRLRYDLLYIENMSLFVDVKILFYTIITIIKGKGV